LTAQATAVGNSCKAICYSDGGGELPTLWMGILAASGVGKTEVLKKLTTPFAKIDAEYAEYNRAELAQYKREEKAGNCPPPPKEKHLLAGNATMEAMLVMCIKSPHPLLLPEPEGRLWFSFDAYRNGKNAIDEPLYCKLYDSAFFKISRRGSDTIEGVGTLNVAMMIQPGNFRKALADNPGMTTSGLLARLNLCYPTVGEFHIAKQIDGGAYSRWNDTVSDMIGNRIDYVTDFVGFQNAAEPVQVFLDLNPATACLIFC